MSISSHEISNLTIYSTEGNDKNMKEGTDIQPTEEEQLQGSIPINVFATSIIYQINSNKFNAISNREIY